jgi:hypothetical protein
MAERARAGGRLAERHDDIGAIASTVLKSPDSPRGMSSRNGRDDARQDMA